MEIGVRQTQVDDLFARAIELPLDQWQTFLDSATVNNDPDLLAEVQKLLAAHVRAMQSTEFLASTPPLPLNFEGEESFIGKVIGRYEITRQLGRGGFGVVFLASRVQDFRQAVAIKFLATSKQWEKRDLARFERERQLLADLQHEHIARLIDGGTTADGAPYIVMEHINGQTIIEYCDAKRLGVMERLTLFSQICDVVAFAHERGVIHRDIKPANIFVTDRGVVKLLDFGIAKMLDRVSDDAANTTSPSNQRKPIVTESPSTPEFDPVATCSGFGFGGPMTPAYASPEQMRGGEITIASDIYSLGVVLYELLTGRRPYDLRYCSTHAEVVKVVCEVEPLLPSTVVRRVAQQLGGIVIYEETGEEEAQKRSTTAGTLYRLLKGDLEHIVMMALRKDPSQRYQSARAFLSDIAHFNNRMPVAARPRSKLEHGMYWLRSVFR